MAFNEGHRDIGLRLLADIMQFCPDRYMEMMRERNTRDNANERRRGQNTDGGVEGPIDSGDDGEARTD